MLERCERLDHQPGAEQTRAVMQLAGRLVGPMATRFDEADGTGVEPLVHAHDRRPRSRCRRP